MNSILSRPRVLLADAHPIVLLGLRKLLERELEVVGTVTNGPELLAAAEHLRPDLVITDIGMPGIDGIEVTRRLQASFLGVRVLVLSIHAEPSYVRAAFGAGAWGYLTKLSAPEEVERAVQEVLAGRFYVSPEVARSAVGRTGTARHFGESPAPAVGDLTPREAEILHLVSRGLNNQQIAHRLGVAVTTVRAHLNSLYKKMQMKSRVALALFAASSSDIAA
jgi:DNA-binding NarL/FixJ family response regulator